MAPYLTLMRKDAFQRTYELREVFNALRYLVRTGAAWRYVPCDLPPWRAVYQQTQHWLHAGVFENMVHDLREVLRVGHERAPQPTAAIFDSRTVQGTLESAGHADYDGYKRKKGSKVHLAVDTLGHLLALRVTAANEGDRAQVAALAQAVQEATGQEATGQSVEVAYVNQGYTGEKAALDAQEHGIRLEVVKLQEAKRGFVLLPKRWVVERSFAWATRFRRLAKDYERLPETVAGLHFLAFACLMLAQIKPFLAATS